MAGFCRDGHICNYHFFDTNKFAAPSCSCAVQMLSIFDALWLFNFSEPRVLKDPDPDLHAMNVIIVCQCFNIYQIYILVAVVVNFVLCVIYAVLLVREYDLLKISSSTFHF